MAIKQLDRSTFSGLKQNPSMITQVVSICMLFTKYIKMNIANVIMYELSNQSA